MARSATSHGVRLLLVGAHALAAHGRPRATQDLDVLVAPSAANARRVGAALAERAAGRTKDLLDLALLDELALAAPRKRATAKKKAAPASAAPRGRGG